MNNYQEDKLLNALEKCKESAEKGYVLAKEATENIDVAIRSISKELITIINGLQSNNSFNDQPTIKHLASQLQTIQDNYATLPQRIMEDIKSLSKSLFSITLFGRTMAGKSTLMETLIKGNGDSIGKGAQRTTRDVRTYKYRGLSVTDVPGIAAFEGHEDEEIAFEAAKESDLILFLITDDAPQASEAEFMSKVVALGKPVLCIINVKVNIASVNDFIMFKRDIIKQYDNNRIDLIKQQFLDFGQQYGQDWSKIQFIKVHLKSAFLSQQDEFKEIGEEIYELSNFEKLENIIINEIIKNGSFYKFKTYSDVITVPLVNTFEGLFDQSAQNSEQGNIIIKKYRKLKKWADEFIIEANERIDSLLNTISSQLHVELASFAEHNYNNIDAGKQWHNIIQSFNIEQRAQSLLQELTDNVINELNEITREIDKELEFSHKIFSDKSISMPKIYNWKKYVRYVLFAAGTALKFVKKPILNLIGDLLLEFGVDIENDYDNKIAKARSELESHIQKYNDKTINTLDRRMRSYLDKKIIRKYINTSTYMLNKSVNSVFTLSDMQYDIAIILNKSLQNINNNLVKYALDYLGYTESIDQVINVARIHGNSIMITLNPGELFDKKARILLSNLLKEQVFFVIKNNNLQSMLHQAIGKGIKIQRISVQEINEKPRIAHIVFADSINQSTKNRIRLAQQVTELLIMK